MIVIETLSRILIDSAVYPDVYAALDAHPALRAELVQNLRAYDGAVHALQPQPRAPQAEAWAAFRMALITDPTLNQVLGSLRSLGAYAIADAIVPAAMLSDLAQLRAAWNAAIAALAQAQQPPINPAPWQAAATAAGLEITFNSDGSIA